MGDGGWCNVHVTKIERRGLSIGLALVIILLFTLPWSKKHQIRMETFEQIVDGLSEADVESIFDAPPGWYAGSSGTPPGDPPLSPKVFSRTGLDQGDGCI